MFSLQTLVAALCFSIPFVHAGPVPIANLSPAPTQTYTLFDAQIGSSTTMSIAYNPLSNKYYIGSGGYQSSPIFEGDAAGNVLRQTESKDDRGVQYRDGNLYVTNYASNQVWIIDTSGVDLQLVPGILLQGQEKSYQSFANTDGNEWISSEGNGIVHQWALTDGLFLGDVNLQGFNVDYQDTNYPGDVLATCGAVWLTYANGPGTIFAWNRQGERIRGWQLPENFISVANQDPYSLSYSDNKFWINNGWSGTTFYGWDLGLPTECPKYGGGGGAIGDPQFTGFNGQSYQVHGTSDTVYNVISSPSFTYNALFSYLSSGKCRSGTACFSHPGNYFGAVGMIIRDENHRDQELLIEAGDVATGMTVRLNNATIPVSADSFTIGDYTVSLPSAFELQLDSNEFALRVQNSDHFLNQDVSIGSGLARKIADYKRAMKSGSDDAKRLAAQLPHGILGQSWSTKTYPNRWKHIEGQLFDYIVQDGIVGHEFKYSRFQA